MKSKLMKLNLKFKYKNAGDLCRGSSDFNLLVPELFFF